MRVASGHHGSPVSSRYGWLTSRRTVALVLLALLVVGLRVVTVPPANAGRAQMEFDPARLGAQEQEMWEAYYYRQWPRLFSLLIQVTREQFGLSLAQSLYAAYLGTQAQRDAVKNGPAAGGAEAYMRDFYAYVKEPTGGRYDPARAAAKEIRWWVVHREAGHRTDESTELEDAFTELYVELYQRPADQMRPAARARARAVEISDRWLDEGQPQNSPLLVEIRTELIASYTALHQALNDPRS